MACQWRSDSGSPAFPVLSFRGHVPCRTRARRRSKPALLRGDQGEVLPAADRVTILTVPKPPQSICPLCNSLSGQVHSHDTRTLADLPWQGRVVVIQVRVRRFRCASLGCPRRVFTERLPEVAPPRARRTVRLGGMQRHIGFALGGEPGSRLAARLSMPVSGDTLLRMIRAFEPEPPAAPRVIGIDEWAYRRGLTYGTILCDLERGRVIDLLPDRSAETVAAWLRRHPSVAVIARDRASVYADGIRQGAPAASEVADRWHLLRNIGDALRAAVDRHRTAVTAAARVVAAAAEDERQMEQAPQAIGTKLGVLRRERRDHRRDCYAEIRRLHEEGVTPQLIACVVGMSQRSVERWLAAGGEPEYRRPRMTTLVDPFYSYLERRWKEGCRTAAALWREIVEQGFTGSLNTVARWVTVHRRSPTPRPAAAAAARAVAAWPAPSRRRCAWLLSLEPNQHSAQKQAFVAHLTAAALGLASLPISRNNWPT